MRHCGEKRIALCLRHAAEETEDRFRPTLGDLPQHPHFSQRFLLRHVAHAAGVEEHDIGVGFPFGALVTAFQERMRDLFRVAFVHLTAVGFNEKLGHRGEMIH